MIIYVIIVLAVLIIWVVSVYNFFVSSKTRIEASIQEIGNQLKRQADLIPNLESSVKGYLSHEKGILQMLSDARKMISTGKDASAKIVEFFQSCKLWLRVTPN